MRLRSVKTYIHSGIKFLKGAFFLDHCCQKEVARRTHLYEGVASLFEYCASVYKRKAHTQAAALAYKCMEVAYLRVLLLSSHPPQVTLGALEKDIMKNAGGDTCNTPGSDHICHYATHTSLAMVVSLKSREELEAFRKCISHNTGCTPESLSAVEKALNFSFQDVDSFLNLVKLALLDIVL